MHICPLKIMCGLGVYRDVKVDVCKKLYIDENFPKILYFIKV